MSEEVSPELRAVLTEALSRSYYRIVGSSSDCRVDPGEILADALLSLPGVAVIQLPKPDEREDEEQEFTDFPGVGLYVPVVFDRHPGEVQIRAGAWCDEPLSVDEARGLAASILAAASYAEEAEE
ncbi:hypothetical protein SEA_SMOOCH_23 [Mycobacterium phage Smooch]|uniref:Uncharacterized protein n=1 Tax=Mycobacterium phage Smooch TaxID=2652896 RepID=A0A5P8DBY2_BPMCO|nr:hypothetical protein SEA_SMOOCH_23 [Mycobacterium phage Smooch]